MVDVRGCVTSTLQNIMKLNETETDEESRLTNTTIIAYTYEIEAVDFGIVTTLSELITDASSLGLSELGIRDASGEALWSVKRDHNERVLVKIGASNEFDPLSDVLKPDVRQIFIDGFLSYLQLVEKAYRIFVQAAMEIQSVKYVEDHLKRKIRDLIFMMASTYSKPNYSSLAII